MPARQSAPIDKLVGARIRIERNLRGLSQSALADQLGITFQQVQKYEKGVNRVGASRLAAIAEILDIPVQTFFESPDAPGVPSKGKSVTSDLLADENAVRLLKAFASVPKGPLRGTIVHLVETLASDNKKRG